MNLKLACADDLVTEFKVLPSLAFYATSAVKNPAGQHFETPRPTDVWTPQTNDRRPSPGRKPFSAGCVAVGISANVIEALDEVGSAVISVGAQQDFKF